MRAAYCIGLLSAIVLGTLGLAAAGAADKELVGRVTATVPPDTPAAVSITRQGETTPTTVTQPQTEVNGGDVITTGEGATALLEVRLPDLGVEADVIVSPQSSVQANFVEHSPKAPNFLVRIGRAIIRLLRGRADGGTQTVAASSTGTAYQVEAARDGTSTITVLEGTVSAGLRGGLRPLAGLRRVTQASQLKVGRLGLLLPNPALITDPKLLEAPLRALATYLPKLDPHWASLTGLPAGQKPDQRALDLAVEALLAGAGLTGQQRDQAGNALASLGLFKAATDSYAEAQKLDPALASAVTLKMAGASYLVGNEEQASNLLTQALVSQPANARANGAMAWLLAPKDPTQAQHYLNMAQSGPVRLDTAITNALSTRIHTSPALRRIAPRPVTEGGTK